MTYVIGVVGQTSKSFSMEEEVWEAVSAELNRIGYGKKDVMVLGGLTDTPSAHRAAYILARHKGWKIGGIACEKAHGHKWFPMSNDGDVLNIVGKTWGDEVQDFVDRVDILVRVGGGTPASKFVDYANEKGLPVVEVRLEPRKVYV